jgi:hypothetical protein
LCLSRVRAKRWKEAVALWSIAAVCRMRRGSQAATNWGAGSYPIERYESPKPPSSKSSVTSGFRFGRASGGAKNPKQNHLRHPARLETTYLAEYQTRPQAHAAESTLSFIKWNVVPNPAKRNRNRMAPIVPCDEGISSSLLHNTATLPVQDQATSPTAAITTLQATHRHKPSFQRHAYASDTASILAFSEEDMYRLANEGINLTRVIMQNWVESLGTEASHFASPFVFGQVKWTEAITATATLGRPNAFTTRAAFSIFAASLDGFGKYTTSLGLILDKLAECCFANYNFIRTPSPESFFDGLSNKEYLNYLQRSIERLKEESLVIEIWKDDARKEKVRTNVMFESILHIWRKGILGVMFWNWLKFHRIHQHNQRRIGFILGLDHANRELDNIWYRFNTWVRHVRFHHKERHVQNAKEAWVIFDVGVEESRVLFEYIHTLKVDIHDLEKKLDHTCKKIDKATLVLEHANEDLTLCRERENFWKLQGGTWAKLATEAYNAHVTGYLRPTLACAVELGIDMIDTPTALEYSEVIWPIEDAAGIMPASRYVPSSVVERAQASEGAQCWLKKRTSSQNTEGDGISGTNILRAMPALPPVFTKEQGRCLVRKIQLAEESYNQVCPYEYESVVAARKTMESVLGEVGEGVIEADDAWASLKAARNTAEHNVWMQLSERVPHGIIEEDVPPPPPPSEEELVVEAAKKQMDAMRYAQVNKNRLEKYIHDRAKKEKLALPESIPDVVAAVHEVLCEYASFTKNVFKNYTGSDNGLSANEFIKLCKDCKLCDKHFKPGDAGRLFITVNLNSDDVDGVDKELDSSEFVECLVYVAGYRFDKIVDLSAAVRSMYTKLIVPNAEVVDLDTFKQLLHDTEIKQIIYPYKPYLKKKFKIFADGDSSQGGGNAMDTMSPKEFVDFAKAMNLMRGRLSVSDAESLFVRVQEGDGDSDDEDEGEMMFSEFLEAVCALVVYEFPLPHESYAQRLARFLLQMKDESIGRVK